MNEWDGTVRIVQTDGGSHVEPALDEVGESDYQKLRWHAAVVAARTGLDVGVEPSIGHEGFDLRVGWTVTGPGYSLGQAWVYLNGVCSGAREAQRKDFL